LKVGALATNGTDLFAGTWGGGIFRSTDFGDSWVPANTGLASMDVRALVLSETNLFAGTYGDGVYRSTNSGSSWTPVDSGLTDLFMTTLVVSPEEAGGTNLLAGTYYGGVFRSTDNGTSWTRLGGQFGCVSALAVSGANIFAGTYDFLWVSTDNGSTWGWRGLGTILNVDDIIIHGTSVLCACSTIPSSYGGVYSSTDNYTTWEHFNPGSSVEVFSLATSGTNLWAGADSGFFLSTDNGSHWSEVNTGLPAGPYAPYSLTVSGMYLFAGMGGVWRRPLSEMTASVEPVRGEVPRELAVSQNYPNPFNPSTVIEFTLPRSGYATLTVHSVLGKMVARLVDGEQAAGTFKATWDASGMPSGVYFYRLTAGEYVHTRKMVLMK